MSILRFDRIGFLFAWWICLMGSAAAVPRTLVFFGDSLTAGHGLEDPSTEAYPALIRTKIEAAGLAWKVVSAGLSGETTAGGLRRVDWVLRQPIDIFVLALGGNDFLRGIDPVVSRANLQGIIDRVQAKYPAVKIVLTGMKVPSSMGADYARAFGQIYSALAEKNQLTLVPFLLEGVGGHSELNQPDGIHPTARGHTLIAETIWQKLRPLL